MAYQFEPETLEGKAVVITGGTTGIGRSTAQRLVADGAKVLIFGRHEQELNEALADIKANADGAEVVGIVADTTKPEDIDRVFVTADEKFGGVDVLINNAAESAESILDSDYPEWQKVIQTNLLGYMATCRKAIDRMKNKHEGQIVNIGSLSAKVREKGSDVYVATKSAIEGFSEALRKEVNEMGIRVTLIEPGLVGTDMTVEKVAPSEQPRKEAEGQMLKAEDIAECVRYALIQPKRCDVVLVQIRPHMQTI
jgi:NADP-dependent 3-hydroxy acid dehydrogenase YdfG